MPYQDFPFNGDTFMEREFLNLKERFDINVVVETGSFIYVSTEWFANNFDKVYTFEINPEYASHGKERIAKYPNAHAYIMDSVEGVKLVSTYVSKRDKVLAFLDAHWLNNCPLLQEIEALSYYPTHQPPVIAIHDFKTDNPELGYDEYHGQPFTYDWIKPAVEKLNASFKDYRYGHYYNKEAIGAKRGVIYLYPEKIKP